VTSPGGEWRLVSSRRIDDGLRDESEEVRRAVLDALAKLLEDPIAPDGLVVHALRGRLASKYPDTYHVELAAGFILSYSVHPNGLPPLGGKLIFTRAFVRLMSDN
jgi:predicted alpha/beta-hydrolase family hydrolase